MKILSLRMRRGAQFVVLSLCMLSLAAACSQSEGKHQNSQISQKTATQNVSEDTRPSGAVHMVSEEFSTVRDTQHNMDSPAVWHGPNGEHWLAVTAKSTDLVLIYDAGTGALIREVGGSGTQMGKFRRPNGIAMAHDLMLVVERDNRRIQVFSLPDCKSIGAFGADTLKRPYGIAIAQTDDGAFNVYITDNYETADERIPPLSDLGERVKQWRVSNTVDNELQAVFVRAFGDTSGSGALHKVESVWADVVYNRLLVADELESQMTFKEYTLDGKYTGREIGDGVFVSEPEGIALYACSDSSGYWVATDQSHGGNTFHVFDRITLQPLGAFSGPGTANTDGIALTQRAFGTFSQGAFYAVNDDGNVSAIGLEEIGNALGLPLRCAETL